MHIKAKETFRNSLALSIEGIALCNNWSEKEAYEKVLEFIIEKRLQEDLIRSLDPKLI